MRSDEGWQTSSWSDSGGQCVAVHRNRMAIRDSKNPDGPRIELNSPAVVAELVRWIKEAH
jgi:hypothetical protein